jgi:hypothetical protein
MTDREFPLLIMEEGKEAGRKWSIDKVVFTIGRAGECDVVLPERQVSRLHARIRLEEGQYILYDLGSKNGTFVNGRLVTGPYILQDGDEIQIALCVKLLFVGAEATAPLLLEERPLRLRLDKEARRVWVRGCEISPPLSLSQYRLLELLYDNEGRVCTRSEIIQAVWPDALEEGVSDQAIDALVRRLRERIRGIDPHHQYVVTVRGHGFRFENIS